MLSEDARRAMDKWLNYHNLYYFWIIARDGSMTAASRRLRLSVSNLSGQMKALEESIGQQLFAREGRGLQLTEAGKIALDYANTIFATGQELFDVLTNRYTPQKKQQVLRIGSLNSMSKNLQYEFIKPLIRERSVQVRITEGSLTELVAHLNNHRLDVILSNMPVRSDQDQDLFNQRLVELPIYLVGVKGFKRDDQEWPKALDRLPCFVPTLDSRIRNDWEHFCVQHRVRPEILAEIEDMALLRILALSGEGCAVVPQVVVQDELKTHKLEVIYRLNGITEIIYAITPRRLKPIALIDDAIETFTREMKSRR
jgi:LysR family transcriptional activator of nhaA